MFLKAKTNITDVYVEKLPTKGHSFKKYIIDHYKYPSIEKNVMT